MLTSKINLQNHVNPDDITAEHFSAGLLTDSEIDAIDKHMLPPRQRCVCSTQIDVH